MKFKDEYSFLSNMFSCKVNYDGEVFPCVETAFQYAKCADEHEQELFVDDRGFWVNGYTARKLGQQVKVRKDWDMYRIDVMYELLENKFIHNEQLREALKATGNRYIQEDNDWGDTFWGVCNGIGQNMLGKMIMEIRQTIQDYDRQEKRVIVAGGRDFNDYKLMCARLDFYFTNIKPIILCGEAEGADTLGKKYAKEHGYKIESYPADWSLGENAGFIRNAAMGVKGDMLVAFWDGKSKDTAHMIDVMQQLNKPVKVVKYV